MIADRKKGSGLNGSGAATPGSSLALTPSPDPSVFSYYARLGRLERYVREHYRERITVAEAAEVAGLSAKYFSTFFRQKAGVCFRDWLAGIRVSEAMRCLTANNDSITRVAFAVGFHDLRTFERSFKKLTGSTPWQFKKSVRPRVTE